MAKKYKFKLETVLKERKRQEDKRLQEWNLARNILGQMVDAKNEMQGKLGQTIVDATEIAEKKDSLSVGNIAIIDQYINGMKIRIQRKQMEIERGEKLTEKKRIEYVQASQKSKTLEKLKEKQKEEYKDYLNKQETKKLDDIYIMRARSLQNDEEGNENG